MNARASIHFVVGAALTACALAAPVRGSLVVPEHSSLPGAPAILYLNFAGDYTSSFFSWSDFTTPAYDIDDNPTDFTPQELSNIDHIWSGVAEKYSPFNLNVTTVDPGTRDDGHTMVIDIGGNGSWTGGLSGGISAVGGFLDGNGTSYAFSSNLGIAHVDNQIVVSPNHTKYVAEAAAHEAGHGFGLRHQSTYEPQFFDKIEEYNSNNHSTVIQPIMGYSYGALRGQWWVGTSVSRSVIQTDLAKLAQTGPFTNNFGYRADDHPNTYASAEAASVATDLAIAAHGIIERTTDIDVFKFLSPGGVVSIFADANPDNPMLDMSLSILDAQGNVLGTSAHPAAADRLSLREYLQLTLEPGQYEISISSAAINPGDIGQYFISGFVAPEPAGALALVCAGLLIVRRRR